MNDATPRVPGGNEASSPVGWTCSRCGCWVSPYSGHICGEGVSTVPQMTVVPQDPTPALWAIVNALQRIADALEREDTP